MAFPNTLFPCTEAFPITNEEFNSFHSIDRALFSRLVLVIGRDRDESIQVMGLWLWLERKMRHASNLISKLMNLSDGLLSMIAQETLRCLTCIMDDFIPVNRNWDENDVPLLHGVLRGPINLFYFYENRVRVRFEVDELIKEVCLRAFDDIALGSGFHWRGGQSSASVLPFSRPCLGASVQPFSPSHVGTSYNVNVVNELAERLGNVMVREGHGRSRFVDEQVTEEVETTRTIFLTFSKGYPISEFEVWNFFTRRCGNIIEEIHMEEVLPGQQALFAKLVVCSVEAIDEVLGGKKKVKFTINGKHVRARKFIKKPFRTSK